MSSVLHPFIGELLTILIKIVLLLVAIAYFTIAERKIMGSIQRRRGPNVVGAWGLLQPAADGLKLIAKEIVVPGHANSRIFVLAPLVVLTLSLLSWSIIPFNLTDWSFFTSLSDFYFSTSRQENGAVEAVTKSGQTTAAVTPEVPGAAKTAELAKELSGKGGIFWGWKIHHLQGVAYVLIPAVIGWAVVGTKQTLVALGTGALIGLRNCWWNRNKVPEVPSDLTPAASQDAVDLSSNVIENMVAVTSAKEVSGASFLWLKEAVDVLLQALISEGLNPTAAGAVALTQAKANIESLVAVCKRLNLEGDWQPFNTALQNLLTAADTAREDGDLSAQIHPRFQSVAERTEILISLRGGIKAPMDPSTLHDIIGICTPSQEFRIRVFIRSIAASTLAVVLVLKWCVKIHALHTSKIQTAKLFCGILVIGSGWFLSPGPTIILIWAGRLWIFFTSTNSRGGDLTSVSIISAGSKLRAQITRSFHSLRRVLLSVAPIVGSSTSTQVAVAAPTTVTATQVGQVGLLGLAVAAGVYLVRYLWRRYRSPQNPNSADSNVESDFVSQLQNAWNEYLRAMTDFGNNRESARAFEALEAAEQKFEEVLAQCQKFNPEGPWLACEAQMRIIVGAWRTSLRFGQDPAALNKIVKTATRALTKLFKAAREAPATASSAAVDSPSVSIDVPTVPDRSSIAIDTPHRRTAFGDAPAELVQARLQNTFSQFPEAINALAAAAGPSNGVPGKAAAFKKARARLIELSDTLTELDPKGPWDELYTALNNVLAANGRLRNNKVPANSEHELAVARTDALDERSAVTTKLMTKGSAPKAPIPINDVIEICTPFQEFRIMVFTRSKAALGLAIVFVSRWGMKTHAMRTSKTQTAKLLCKILVIGRCLFLSPGPTIIVIWAGRLWILFTSSNSKNGSSFVLVTTNCGVPDFKDFKLITESDDIGDVNYGLLAILALSSLGVYGLIISGWASNSKYAFLGALRSAAQRISYEVAISLVLLPIVARAVTLNFTEIASAQNNTVWFIAPLLPASQVYFISRIAETNRTPFDLPEAEAELVAGYNIDYSSIIFARFFLAEYGNRIRISLQKTILFLGGWAADDVLFTSSPLVFALKGLIFCFLFVLVRATFPRYRYDQLRDLGWKIFLPVATGFLVQTIGCLFSVDGLPIAQQIYYVDYTE